MAGCCEAAILPSARLVKQTPRDDGHERGHLGLAGAVLADLATVKLIGRGAFGVVRLCQSERSGELFALKEVRLAAPEGAEAPPGGRHPGPGATRPVPPERARAEAEALSSAARHREGRWVVGLHMAFQDDAGSFYFVMDFVPGGDLVTHLQVLDTFNEEEARFYTAELVEAVDYIHTKLGYIHRDIKPDNIVLDAHGHVRVVDFGGCRSLGHGGGQCEPSLCAWGAPPYVAPEVHRRECYGVGFLVNRRDPLRDGLWRSPLRGPRALPSGDGQTRLPVEGAPLHPVLSGGRRG
ncbi:unnamed protein product [Prorocentrum cordatum]|uniref:non-specific serine/threonine protein kinase n=1 Tax=Prorocentrum cordatum TaxID=2364126 RepID=A0ABN9V1Z1_9DINO|nr:unnamed protein product [Polarella glacialis]